MSSEFSRSVGLFETLTVSTILHQDVVFELMLCPVLLGRGLDDRASDVIRDAWTVAGMGRFRASSLVSAAEGAGTMRSDAPVRPLYGA